MMSVNRDQKVVEHLSMISDTRDLHYILTEYLKHCTSDVRNATDQKPVKLLNHAVHLLSKDKAAHKTIWYSQRQIGKNYFAQLFKESITLAGISDNQLQYTLRIIRSSTITKLRSSGKFSDAEIRTRTGHISDRSLSSYERPSQKDLTRKLSAVIRGLCLTFGYIFKSLRCITPLIEAPIEIYSQF